MKENWVRYGCVRPSLSTGSLPGNRKAKLNREGLAQARMVERGMWAVGRVLQPEEGRATEPKTPT